jgi:heptaprenyl diphosphate synthase
MTQLHTDQDKNKTNLVAVRGLLVAAAFVLAWLEAQVPVFFAVPGMKLGLTNLVVLMALYKLGWKDALALNFLRIVLTGFTFGNVFSMIYSLAGGMLSCLVMIFLKRSDRFHMVTVSIAGGVFHNVGQILVAMMVLGSTYVFYYLPVLWVSGLAAGALIGFLGAQVVRRLPDTLV